MRVSANTSTAPTGPLPICLLSSVLSDKTPGSATRCHLCGQPPQLFAERRALCYNENVWEVVWHGKQAKG